jgi:hypothetical protein
MGLRVGLNLVGRPDKQSRYHFDYGLHAEPLLLTIWVNVVNVSTTGHKSTVASFCASLCLTCPKPTILCKFTHTVPNYNMPEIFININ